ncbi:hypothetical protein [Aquabacterium humicola]|uniref:hypothetical protein n=1 Tax=Aquabacterium humicola TaxID=3237377 RepID=UPI002543334F|nr:hypothetical protein [Rubrivivax pictus]
MDESSKHLSEMFQRKLKVQPELAERFIAAGMTSIEEVAYYPLTELLEISKLGPEEASDLRRVARLYLQNEDLDDLGFQG